MTDFRDEPSLEKFARSIILLAKRVRAEAPAAMHDLTATQRSTLMTLDTDGPMTSAALARAEGITPQSMGTALVSLEQLGYVDRTRHPTDGRQVLLSLTRKGKAVRKATREAKEKWLNGALSQLKKDDLDVLREAGDIIHRMLEKSPASDS